MKSAIMMLAAVAGAALAAGPAGAESDWQPFAEQDLRAAQRTARKEPQSQPRPAQPYLEPMSEADRRRVTGQFRVQPPKPGPARPDGGGWLRRQKGAVQGEPEGEPRRVLQGAPFPSNGAPGTYVQQPPAAGAGFQGGAAAAVERGELSPVVTQEGVLAGGIWQGLDAATAEQLLAQQLLPPASPALNALLMRLLSEPVEEPSLNAVRLAGLWKSGRFDIAASNLQAITPDFPPDSLPPNRRQGTRHRGNALEDLLAARIDLANGQTDRACRRIKRAVAGQATLNRTLRGEAIASAGYCAIIAGNTKAGALAAELARDAGYGGHFTLALLEAVGGEGSSPRVALPRRVTLLDGLLVRQLSQPSPALLAGTVARATPQLLHVSARDDKLPPGMRLMAAEKAAARNIIDGAVLASVYRAVAPARPASRSASGPALVSGARGGAEGRFREAGRDGSDNGRQNAGGDGAVSRGDVAAAFERARWFVAAEQNQAQFARTRAVRALLDRARVAGLYHAAAMAMQPLVAAMRPAQEITWFTETAIEVLAAAGDYAGARQWLANAPPPAAGDALDHWRVLLDVADPAVPAGNRGRGLQALENLARGGRFSQAALHRLVTVLDALDYNVPIPLWNLASRTAQPQTGHLPETGVLTALKRASEAGETAATVLYVLRTVAPAGTSATHLIGLGESIRALKRAGLEGDARRLAFEALFGDWPRSQG